MDEQQGEETMQAKLKNLITKLRSDERGLSTVEYVVLLVLIVAIAVALWNVFGNLLVQKLSGAANEFDKQVVTAKNGENEAALDEGKGEEDINKASGLEGN
jgi:Flp pilus assembly pilin Flp